MKNYDHFQRQITHQRRRNAWRKAESPSIRSNINTVNDDHGIKTKNEAIEPPYPSIDNPIWKTIFHNTSDNSIEEKIESFVNKTWSIYERA